MPRPHLFPDRLIPLSTGRPSGIARLVAFLASMTWSLSGGRWGRLALVPLPWGIRRGTLVAATLVLWASYGAIQLFRGEVTSTIPGATTLGLGAGPPRSQETNAHEITERPAED